MSVRRARTRRPVAVLLLLTLGSSALGCGRHYQAQYTDPDGRPRLDLTRVQTGDEVALELTDGEVRRGLVQGITPYAVQLNDYWYEIEFIADLVVLGRPEGRGGFLAAALGLTIVAGLLTIFVVGGSMAGASEVGN